MTWNDFFPCNERRWTLPSGLQMIAERKEIRASGCCKNRRATMRRFGPTARIPIRRRDPICPRCRARLSREDYRTHLARGGLFLLLVGLGLPLLLLEGSNHGCELAPWERVVSE